MYVVVVEVAVVVVVVVVLLYSCTSVIMALGMSVGGVHECFLLPLPCIC